MSDRKTNIPSGPNSLENVFGETPNFLGFLTSYAKQFLFKKKMFKKSG
jgi:hypothetical protein